MESEEEDRPNMVEALLYLANYYKTTKRFENAEVYCTGLLDYTGHASLRYLTTLSIYLHIL
jgi:anaphase-promoting complex subunit 8